MPLTEETFETIHKVPPARHHFLYLTAPSGSFLQINEDGVFDISTETNDRVLWEETAKGEFRHVSTCQVVRAEANNPLGFHIQTDSGFYTIDERPVTFRVERGPERLPSEYLREFQEQGWVCITNILPDHIVEALEQVACTDRYAGERYDGSQPAICQHPAVAFTAAEPVSLWVIRQYMQTPDIRFSHVPAFAILSKDDGERNVQGWHSDYPYHWGIPAKGQVPTSSGRTVLGVQRNVCVSDFTKLRGATIFKLGSHARDSPPPAEWGDATAHSQPGFRAKNGLPYGGPEADVIEAPGGSIILYDSRTWHRQGVNRSELRRAAMLQAMTPMYVMPKNDTSQAYKAFVGCESYKKLSSRVKQTMEELMVHRFIGPGGSYAIAPDRELTAIVRERNSTSSY